MKIEATASLDDEKGSGALFYLLLPLRSALGSIPGVVIKATKK
nr:MAG TPA: hypothetical protein [Caudoviricetes sp.]